MEATHNLGRRSGQYLNISGIYYYYYLLLVYTIIIVLEHISSIKGLLRNDHHGHFQLDGGWKKDATKDRAKNFAKTYEPTNTRLKILDLFGSSRKADAISVSAPISDIVIAFTFEDAPNFITIFNKEFIYDNRRRAGSACQLHLKKKFKAAFDFHETKTDKEIGDEMNPGTSGLQAPLITPDTRSAIGQSGLPKPDLRKGRKSSKPVVDESKASNKPDETVTETDTNAIVKPLDSREIKIKKEYIIFKSGTTRKKLKIKNIPKNFRDWIPKDRNERAELIDSDIFGEGFDIFDEFKQEQFEKYYFVPIDDFLTKKQTTIVKTHWSTISDKKLKKSLPTPMGYILMDSSKSITHFTGIFVIIRSFLLKI